MIEMKKYNVKWLEEHEASVNAENEELAVSEAMEYAGGHSTIQDAFNFRIEREE